MNDKAFLDTNVLIYLYSADEPQKQAIAAQIIQTHPIILSTQVINEFINVMLKKYKLTTQDIAHAIGEISANLTVTQITPETILQALRLVEQYRFSYFDSLILSSALENQCSILYTEDLQHQQLIEKKLHVKNPFAERVLESMSKKG